MSSQILSREWSEHALRVLLDEWDSVRLRVTGDCMAPALRHGDVVALQPTRRTRPAWGDVVLARTPGGLRLHRVIWPGVGGVWRTKGDRAPFWDGPLAGPDILAVVPENRHRLAALVSLWGALAAGSLARLRRVICP